MLKWVAAALMGTASLPGHAITAGSSYSAVYVFGDSLSDSGNNYYSFGGLTGPNPPSGTFIPTLPYAPSSGNTNTPDYSNGATWVTNFAAGLGLPGSAAASLAGGGDYAYGGARMSTDGSGAPAPLPADFPPSLQTQLNTYLTTGPAVSSTALYVIAGGGNDVRDVGALVAGGAPLVSTATAAALSFATTAAQMVGSLKAAGATNIVVWDVPDIGKTPAAGSGVGATATAATFISGVFNSALDSALAGSGAKIFDIFGLMDSWVADPSVYGFSNVTQACGFTGNGCNPSTALFWDGIHPTAYAQSLVASAMLAAVAVPEPSITLMLTGGLLVLVAVRRRA